VTKRLRVPVRPRRLLPTEVMTNARRARTTLSERPMATARVKAMPPVGNGKTARPVTNAAHMATVKTRAAIRAKVIPAKVTSATIDAMTAAPPSAAPLAATMSAHRSASRPHGATTVAPTAATSVAMTAAPWAPATARATPMRAPTCAQRSPREAMRPRLPPPRSTTTVASACPS